MPAPRYISPILPALVASALVVLGCTATPEPDSLLDYSRKAELEFQAAMDEFEDDDCTEAKKLFEEVRRKYPYSGYAVLAELRGADCDYQQGSFAEAAVGYQSFVRVHPTHAEAHDAAFRRGLSYYRMIPSDFLITPPAHERDQSATRDARFALQEFITTYPASPWQNWARVLLGEVEDALVGHEIYVARFYLSRGNREAAAVRLEGIRQHFGSSTLVPDALFLQAMTYLELNRVPMARGVLLELVKHYPKHHQSLRAKDYLGHLEAKGLTAN